jgi:hypothetical protein
LHLCGYRDDGFCEQVFTRAIDTNEPPLENAWPLGCGVATLALFATSTLGPPSPIATITIVEAFIGRLIVVGGPIIVVAGMAALVVG